LKLINIFYLIPSKISPLGIALIGIYFLALALLSLYSLYRIYLVYLYFKNKKKIPRPERYFESLPVVTIQLPIYNEMYVVEQLLDTVSKIDYPRHLLEIQVLDGSTDNTQDLAKTKVKELLAKGYDVHYISRDNECGYKAGALIEGLKTAKGEFIAIFDSDFSPSPDFLHKTIHFFTDPHLAVVQTRWGHLNNGHSSLTEAESILLDGHLILEQTARNRSKRFIQFNGSAGIWRKKAIEDAGGWYTDTLTEDLDISYRAQLKGWKFVFLKDVITPGELPPDMNEFKSQQLKWAIGITQVGRKLIKSILKAKIPLFVKLDIFADLMGYSMHLFLLLIAILMLPFIWCSVRYDIRPHIILQGIIFSSTMISFCLFYLVSQIEAYNLKNGVNRFARHFPMLLILGTGLSINNTWGVLKAIIWNKTECMRTPKFGLHATQNNFSAPKYKNNRSFLPLVELGMGIYFIYLVLFSVIIGSWAIIPFELMFLIGFLYVAFRSLFQDKLSLNQAE
jgi:cellulose synthase/poly-beta-1,6-N-acetylglucosamine synthase-like glycosyltransferase